MSMDPQDAPDYRQLWCRAHVARKAKECDLCHDPIAPGQRYEDHGYLLDGKFERMVCHQYGERYPSGCPRQGARDRAEAEEQFRKDEAMMNGGTA